MKALAIIEETTGKNPTQLVVDRGFTTRADILAADARGINLIGPMVESSAGKTSLLSAMGIAEDFSPDKFKFDPERNTCICPRGLLLHFRQRRRGTGKILYIFEGTECTACPSKPSCCPWVCFLENDPRITTFLAKMETDEAKAIYKQRAEVAEFPNLWIKEKFGLRQFSLRGLIKAERRPSGPASPIT